MLGVTQVAFWQAHTHGYVISSWVVRSQAGSPASEASQHLPKPQALPSEPQPSPTHGSAGSFIDWSDGVGDLCLYSDPPHPITTPQSGSWLNHLTAESLHDVAWPLPFFDASLLSTSFPAPPQPLPHIQAIDSNYTELFIASKCTVGFCTNYSLVRMLSFPCILPYTAFIRCHLLQEAFPDFFQPHQDWSRCSFYIFPQPSPFIAITTAIMLYQNCFVSLLYQTKNTKMTVIVPALLLNPQYPGHSWHSNSCWIERQLAVPPEHVLVYIIITEQSAIYGGALDFFFFFS